MERELYRVAVMGASGYAGMALVTHLMGHRRSTLSCLTAHNGAGAHLKASHPTYEALGQVGLLRAHEEVLANLEHLEVIFMALPHGVSQQWVKTIRSVESAKKLTPRLIIDLSGDYRLTLKDYEHWYHQPHSDAENLSQMIYGLAPLFPVPLGSKSISNPGCYPTASLLAAAPLAALGLVATDDLVIDAKSGVSGAGRSLALGNLYCEANENLKPYSVAHHRHTPEIEHHLQRVIQMKHHQIKSVNMKSVNMESKCLVQFTPHLVPMQHGLLASVYARYMGPSQEMPTDEDLVNLYREYYANSPVVKVIEGMPETRWAVGTPYAYIGVKADPRTRRVMAFCAIDNTLMGAATQAITNMNLALGFPALEGLTPIA